GFFVERFEEKPTIEKAKEYIKEGNYFWNAGIFIFKTGFFLDELKKYDPEIFTTLEKIKEKKEKKQIITEDDFMVFKSISIDYSLMEKTKKLVVIPSDFGWNDIGSFKSLYEVQDKDRSNNSIKMNRDDFINIDSKNLLVIGENKQITAINLKNLAIIDTKDALLISNLDNSEKVKSVYERLVEKNSKTCENHLKITTDWGQSEILIDQTDYLIRKIIINTDKAVDLYKNDKRTKNITVLSGSLELIYKNDKKILKEKDSINIQPDEKIKLICKTKSVEFLEVSFN
ncbi:MAG: hypothetical protein JXB50_14120, partial [Spirochaetes bacterium]|nr:hypothetical protein [Spirochaetota bacterium]